VASEHTGVTGIAGRYASALFDLADEERRLDEIAQDLAGLQAMIDGSEDLKRLIRSPVIPRADQERAITAVLERAGASGLTRKFVGLVARNRRLFVLEDMIAGYRALLAARRGQQTAVVTSAQPLSEAHRARLVDTLRRATGGDVALDTRVDPSLIGGLIIRLGSRMIDSSLRTKLQRLQLALKGAA
jgi:F-type H+-transporting ATPase subunit delta